MKKQFDTFGLENDSVYCDAALLEENAGKMLEQCRLFGTNRIRIGSIPAKLSGSIDGYKTFAENLNRAGKIYREAGIKIMYHFHTFEFTRFGELTGLEVLLNESDPDFFALIPDTHWIQSGGKNILAFLTKYRDRYDYVHFKDYAVGGRKEKLEERPILFAPVGEGNLEWEPIISLCKENGVRSIAIEQDDCYGRNPFDCVKSSFDFMQKMGADE